MALICDTSGLFALYDTSNVDHAATVAVVEGELGELLVPVVLLVEIDYMLHSRLGADAARDFLEAVERGDFVLVPFLPADVVRCGELLTRYRSMDIDLADAAVVATAERLGIPSRGSCVWTNATFVQSPRETLPISSCFRPTHRDPETAWGPCRQGTSPTPANTLSW